MYLLAKLEKQFTETTKLDGMIRENMRGLGYNINTWDIIYLYDGFFLNLPNS
jgi:hypothetical protein